MKRIYIVMQHDWGGEFSTAAAATHSIEIAEELQQKYNEQCEEEARVDHGDNFPEFSDYHTVVEVPFYE